MNHPFPTQIKLEIKDCVGDLKKHPTIIPTKKIVF